VVLAVISLRLSIVVTGNSRDNTLYLKDNMAHLLANLPNKSGKLTQIHPGSRIIQEPSLYCYRETSADDAISAHPIQGKHFPFLSVSISEMFIYSLKKKKSILWSAVVRNISNLTLRTFARKQLTVSGSDERLISSKVTVDSSSGKLYQAHNAPVTDTCADISIDKGRVSDRSSNSLNGPSFKRGFGARGAPAVSFGHNGMIGNSKNTISATCNSGGFHVRSAVSCSTVPSGSAGSAGRMSLSALGGQRRPPLLAPGCDTAGRQGIANSGKCANIIDRNGSGGVGDDFGSRKRAVEASTTSSRPATAQLMQLKRIKR
jgi:hypothetical protein